ncbi:SH2 domain-containing protein 2A [Ambystoma mexicanum]|uniref:SH2 domain-containing protein 2A n=1 Tax=Ambystoma mexicanum TaxID=8296 RepID=UPI0037E8CF21
MDFAHGPKKGKDIEIQQESHLFTTAQSLKAVGNIWNHPTESPSRLQPRPPGLTQKPISDTVHSTAVVTGTCCSLAVQSALKPIRFPCSPSRGDRGDVQVCIMEDWVRGNAPARIPEESVAEFQAETQRWFKETQASRILPQGETPEWFHGFTTRREAEEMLQKKPMGCFLVRFCESKVGFVLSYKSRERCRHFLLEQLPDERYVILGEDTSHASVQELLSHYCAAPIEPYREILTFACSKNSRPGDHQPYTKVNKQTKPVPPPTPALLASLMQHHEDCPARNPKEEPMFNDCHEVLRTTEEAESTYPVQSNVTPRQGPYTQVKKLIKPVPPTAPALPAFPKPHYEECPSHNQEENVTFMDCIKVERTTEEAQNAPTVQRKVTPRQGDHQAYTKVKKHIKPVPPTAPALPAFPKPHYEDCPAHNQEEQVPDFVPPLPVKSEGTSETEEGPVPLQNEVQHIGHAPLGKAPIPDSESTSKASSADHKYSLLVELHTYTESADHGHREKHIYHEPHETIDFYAMGRGSPCEKENIYSEVELKQSKPPSIPEQEEWTAIPILPLPISRARVIPNKASTLPPRSQKDALPVEPSLAHRLLFRRASRQAAKSQVSASLPKKSLCFDDPVYSRQLARSTSDSQAAAAAPENIYERISEEQLTPGPFSTFKDQ